MNNQIASADQVIRSINQLPSSEIRMLQDQHNMNLHSDGTGDDAFDSDDEFAGLSIIGEVEFIERYVD